MNGEPTTPFVILSYAFYAQLARAGYDMTFYLQGRKPR